MIDINIVKNEVFEGVARLTSSYTADQLEEDWILGGGVTSPNSVGLSSSIMQTLLRPNANLYIEGVREDENRVPNKNDIKRSEIGTGNTLKELVDLVFAKIQED